MQKNELLNFVSSLATSESTKRKATSKGSKSTKRKPKQQRKPLTADIDANTPIWHKRPDETTRQYILFEMFRELPPDAKGLAELTRKKADFRSTKYIEKMRQRFNWDARRTAFLEFLAAEADAARTAAAVTVAQESGEQYAFDWTEWHLKNLTTAREIADQLLVKTKEIVNLPILQRTRADKPLIGADGKPVLGVDGKPLMQEVTILKPSRFSVGDAPRFAEAALVLAQYVREQMHFVGNTVDRDLPTPAKPLDEMTQEELDAYIQECRAAKDAIIRGDVCDATGGMPS